MGTDETFKIPRHIKRILENPPPELSLEELQRLTRRDGSVRIETKQQRRRREQLSARIAKAKQAAHRRRHREVRAGLALLGGKGDHERAKAIREWWKYRLRPPAGSLKKDRLIVAALWPPEWRTAHEIGERLDWARFGARRMYGLLARLERHGIVERRARNGPLYIKGARGRQSALLFRLTQAGIDLRHAIEAGSVPPWESMEHSQPRPVGEHAGEAKVLRAMTPGTWCSIGDLLKLSPGNASTRCGINNVMQRLLRAGAVTKAQNPKWQQPGPETKVRYLLTASGEKAREGLMLIG